MKTCAFFVWGRGEGGEKGGNLVPSLRSLGQVLRAVVVDG